MRYKLVIFDWDGTLMDSLERIVSSMRHAAKKTGLPLPQPAAVRDIIGLSFESALPKLFGDDWQLHAPDFIEHYRSFYQEIDETPSPLYPGADLVVQGLYQQGYQLAISTGKGHRGLSRVLKSSGLEHYFHATRGADQARSKPDPLMLEQILQELDLTVSDAVMVGDSRYDMAMAEAIGMDRIAVTYGVHGPEELDSHQPVAYLNDIRELPGYL
ncbi:HAD family hydrolase [Dongshaea marina]|uniref:HAD family hydrolase n=1 Tax=Dongshaea marina TaxID=2047966 RepID=UPI000D3E2637|nr:HAD-IA family hydrolase [Dongshaea marina]